MSQISNQLRSYAAVVAGSPPTPTSLITPLLPSTDLPCSQEKHVEGANGGFMMKCIWHDDRTRSCICPTRGMVEAGERSFEDKRTKEDGKIKDDKEELKESKKDEKEEDKKENVKEIEDEEGAVWIKTPPTSRWSKTPTELAREASRMPSTARNVPASERKESRFAKRWAEDERMERRQEEHREERRREMIQEWDLDFAQLGLEVETVGIFNRASYELHGLGLVSRL